MEFRLSRKSKICNVRSRAWLIITWEISDEPNYISNAHGTRADTGCQNVLEGPSVPKFRFQLSVCLDQFWNLQTRMQNFSCVHGIRLTEIKEVSMYTYIITHKPQFIHWRDWWPSDNAPVAATGIPRRNASTASESVNFYRTGPTLLQVKIKIQFPCIQPNIHAKLWLHFTFHKSVSSWVDMSEESTGIPMIRNLSLDRADSWNPVSTTTVTDTEPPGFRTPKHGRTLYFSGEVVFI